MSFLQEMLGMYGNSVDQGYLDLLALVPNSPRHTSPEAIADDIRARDIIAAQSFSFKHKQDSSSDARYGGEGANSNTLAIMNASLVANFKIPLMSQIAGWVDPAVGMLWDFSKRAYYGTSTTAIGGLATAAIAGDSYLITTNIADFLSIPLPFTLSIIPITGEVAHTVTIDQVDKRLRRMRMTSSLVNPHSLGTLLAVRPDISGGPRDPAFSLLSMSEGLLAPCLVGKISINAKAGEQVLMEVEAPAININREQQIGLRGARQTILAEYSEKLPGKILNGGSVKISAVTNNDGDFGLSSALGDRIFSGFQGLGLPDISVTGISVSVDNNIKEVYTSHSITGNRRDNDFPYALVSEGRTISGTINYIGPVEPFALAERLSGPSSLASGILIDYGFFTLSMRDIAWSPSSSDSSADGIQTKTIDWKLVGQDFDGMPEMGFSSRV